MKSIGSRGSSPLRTLADQTGLHPLVAGRAVRLLHDAGTLEDGEVSNRLSLALSPSSEPAHGAAWIEGFLSGSGALLIHDETMWQIVDDWVSQLTSEHFITVLPLLRRTFSTFAPAERRQMGERVRRDGGGWTPRTPAADEEFDYEAANGVLPLLAKILGVESSA